jgi:hypothetical protein
LTRKLVVTSELSEQSTEIMSKDAPQSPENSSSSRSPLRYGILLITQESELIIFPSQPVMYAA